MKTTARHGILMGVIAGGLSAGCALPGRSAAQGDAITQVLEAQARAWNEGELDRFMEPYWHSPDLTFSSGGKTTRGWDETLERYRRRYPDRAAMGHLTFGDLEVRELSPRVAMVLGRWRLERERPIGGNFTLVMRKQEGRWIILHDHTSSDETP